MVGLNTHLPSGYRDASHPVYRHSFCLNRSKKHPPVIQLECSRYWGGVVDNRVVVEGSGMDQNGNSGSAYGGGCLVKRVRPVALKRPFVSDVGGRCSVKLCHEKSEGSGIPTIHDEKRNKTTPRRMTSRLPCITKSRQSFDTTPGTVHLP